MRIAGIAGSAATIVNFGIRAREPIAPGAPVAVA
jgi:hypothetical protein